MLDTRVNYISSNSKYEVVIYDDSPEKDYLLVGRGCLVIDRKMEGKPAGLVEDIWVHEDYRKQGLGKDIMRRLKEIAEKKECYKMVLICAEHNIPFYESCGFYKHQVGMRLDV